MLDVGLLAQDVKHMLAAGYALAFVILLVAGKAVGKLTAIIVNQTRFGSSAELESTLHNYLKIYNNSIPQRALKHQTPIQALKMWQEKKPDLFVKRVYNHTGLDT